MGLQIFTTLLNLLQLFCNAVVKMIHCYSLLYILFLVAHFSLCDMGQKMQVDVWEEISFSVWNWRAKEAWSAVWGTTQFTSPTMWELSVFITSSNTAPSTCYAHCPTFSPLKLYHDAYINAVKHVTKFWHRDVLINNLLTPWFPYCHFTAVLKFIFSSEESHFQLWIGSLGIKDTLGDGFMKELLSTVFSTNLLIHFVYSAKVIKPRMIQRSGSWLFQPRSCCCPPCKYLHLFFPSVLTSPYTVYLTG